MSNREARQTQTVLEYLVMINEQSYSGIGRQLQITPQQFSDWIKKRRPIPQERQQKLSDYFGVEAAVFVDSDYFAKPLSPLAKLNLHLILIDQKVAQLEIDHVDEEDIEPYREKKRKLLQEKKDLHRLERMSDLLEQHDERIHRVFDKVLGELEAGRIEQMEEKLINGVNE
ncbi:XRE family transcriptional regulator [Paenibacillus sp. TRM 82003]|nr:XRE family transcriptional regulator [Paenibacillus sp. TRM 82003]